MCESRGKDGARVRYVSQALGRGCPAAGAGTLEPVLGADQEPGFSQELFVAVKA